MLYDSIDDKNLKENKAKIDSIYAQLSKTVEDYYNKKSKDSQKDLDVLVKNGVIIGLRNIRRSCHADNTIRTNRS